MGLSLSLSLSRAFIFFETIRPEAIRAAAICVDRIEAFAAKSFDHAGKRKSKRATALCAAHQGGLAGPKGEAAQADGGLRIRAAGCDSCGNFYEELAGNKGEVGKNKSRGRGSSAFPQREVRKGKTKTRKRRRSAIMANAMSRCQRYRVISRRGGWRPSGMGGWYPAKIGRAHV